MLGQIDLCQLYKVGTWQSKVAQAGQFVRHGVRLGHQVFVLPEAGVLGTALLQL